LTNDNTETEPRAEGGEAQPRPRRFGPLKREVRAALELFAIAGLAFAQPALDLLTKNTEIFVIRRSTPAQVIALTLAILLVPPVVAWWLEVLVGLVVPTARRYVHAGLVAVFAGVLAEESFKQATELGPVALVVAGIVFAVVVAVLVIRFDAARTFLRFLAIAPVVFAVLFLTSAQIGTAVFDGSSAGAADVTIKNPKRVVMIVLDEMPLETILDGSGHVDASLFPNFAALARSSTWYRNDASVAPFTINAVPAVMTGQYPNSREDLPNATDHPDSIFRLLGDEYRMNVHELVTDVCPEQVCTDSKDDTSFVPAVRALTDETADLWHTFVSPHRTQPLLETAVGAPALPQAKQFLRSLKPGSEPTFDFLHVLLPHQHWHYLPTWQDNGVTPENPTDGRSINRWADETSLEDGHIRHILQTQATDRFIGRVVAKLQRIGAWDDTLFVVTADHGIAFRAGSTKRSATPETADQVLWTPLFVKAPGQTGGVVDDRPMQSVDVVPTMADILGVKVPWKLDGTSALGPPRKDFPRRFYQWDAVSGAAQPGVPLAKGTSYLTFPGEENFQKVMHARGAPAGGDDALRPYRMGPWGDLVGRRVDGLVQDGSQKPSLLYVPNPASFKTIQPDARVAPWTYVSGYVKDFEHEVPLAFAVNGTIGGVTTAVPLEGSTGYYSVSLPPSLFRAGSNVVSAYVISGNAAAPALVPVRVWGLPGAPGASGG
jgi:hypothetical protein